MSILAKKNKLSITLTSDDNITKNVSFELYKDSKQNKICFNLFIENQQIGILDCNINDFNNFCLDLFNENKKLNGDEKIF